MKTSVLYIASVFAFRGRADPYMSLSRWVAIVGVTVSLWVLITSMAAITGVRNLTEQRFLQMLPHVIMRSYVPQDDVWAPVLEQVRGNAIVRGASLALTAPAFAVYNDKVEGVVIHGVQRDDREQVLFDTRTVIDGSWQDLSREIPGVVIGRELAEKLQLKVGERLPLVLSRGKGGALSQELGIRSFEVVAIFDSGSGVGVGVDAMLVLMDDAALRSFVGLPPGLFNALYVKLKDPFLARSLVHEWKEYLPLDVSITDWIAQGATVFGHINSSKRLVALSLIAILVVASFNVATMLLLIVKGKREEIAILRSLGASRKTVGWIFLLLGVTIGVPGVLVGSALGLLTSANLGEIYHFIEHVLGMRLMGSDIYPVRELVGLIDLHEVFYLDVLAIGLCMAMSMYPAWLASRVDPGIEFRVA